MILMKSILALHGAVYEPIADLITYRAMPTREIEHLDPFLFLNHHGPQVYPPGNRGLPFGPHPHRGFETLTYVLKGDLMHWDSSGAKSVIQEGGIQWMTAGRGLIHSEISSEEFKRDGGEVEVIQLWLNLPAKHKMADPGYLGLAGEELVHLSEDEGRVQIHLVSGEWRGVKGPIQSLAGLTMTSIDLAEGGRLTYDVPDTDQLLFYVVRGSVSVNGTLAATHQLVAFDMEGSRIELIAEEETLLIFGHGTPFYEPIVARGPFVVNSEEELYQAYRDYQSGKMGTWNG